jgi:hypothetical protein
MDKNLQFANAAAFIEVPLELREADKDAIVPSEISSWADNAAQLLDSLPSGVVFRIGKLRLTHEESRSIAVRIADLILHALRSRGVPKRAFIEIDRIRPVKVWKHQVRTLLPHTDGAHCSYLTPSLLDVPNWDVHLRTFSYRDFSTTGMHKMYQGIFIVDPGNGISVTTYYDWLKVLSYAYSLASHKREFPIEELQLWLGQNIRNAIENQPLHKNRYLSIGAALGSKRVSYQGTVIHAAEEELTLQEKTMFPELSMLDASLHQSKNWMIARTQFLSMILSDVLGMTWKDFRAAYEICVPSERFDYVLGHNLVLLHGGLMGGPARRLEPISVAIDLPRGDDYEQWLSRAWRRDGSHRFVG